MAQLGIPHLPGFPYISLNDNTELVSQFSQEVINLLTKYKMLSALWMEDIAR